MKNFLTYLPKNAIIGLIHVYQKTISPDHGLLRVRYPYGFCRHYPTCSEYTKQSVVKFGVIRGLWLGFLRILRCTPWSKPSVDILPTI